MNKVGIIIVSLILAMVVGAGGCVGIGGPSQVSHEVPYEHQGFTVKPGYRVKKPIPMDTGAILEGYFIVRGGNDDIKFYIEDPYDWRVLDITVRDRYEFHYKTTSEGPHFVTIYFDNSFSILTSKQVDLHWRSVVTTP